MARGVHGDGLTERRARFVPLFVSLGNATEAYIQAGFRVKSRKVAQVSAAQLLSMPIVRAAVERERERVAEKLRSKTDITQERLMAEYARIGFSDQRDFVAWGPDGVRLRDSSELTEDQARAVVEVSETRTKGGSTVRLKLHDKKGALDSLSERLWPAVKRSEVSGPGGGPIQAQVALLEGVSLERLLAVRQELAKLLEGGKDGET